MQRGSGAEPVERNASREGRIVFLAVLLGESETPGGHQDCSIIAGSGRRFTSIFDIGR